MAGDFDPNGLGLAPVPGAIVPDDLGYPPAEWLQDLGPAPDLLPIDAPPVDESMPDFSWVPESWMPAPPADDISAPAPISESLPVVPDVAPPELAAAPVAPEEPARLSELEQSPGQSLPADQLEQLQVPNDDQAFASFSESAGEPSAVPLTLEEQTIQDAEADARREQGRLDLLAERQLEEIRLNNERAQASADAAREAQANAAAQLAEVDEDVARLGRTKINPDRFWQSRTTGQRIAGILSAGLGGLLNPKGRNSTLELINAAIDRDIQAQVADLGNERGALNERRGIVAELYERTKDGYRAAETARIAYLGSVDQQLAAEAARYDPDGTTAARIRTARQTVQAESAAARARLEQSAFERSLKKLSARKTQAEIDKLQADAALAARKAAGGAGTKKKKVYDVPAYADPELKEIYARDPKEAQRIQDGGIRDPFTGDYIRQPDGAFFVPSLEEGKGLRDRMAKVSAASDLIEKIRALREEHGQEVDLFKSAAGQAMKSSATNLMLVLKDAFQTGALDKGSVEILEQMTGGDQTAFRSALASIETVAENMESAVNSELKARGYRGRYKLPKVLAAPKRTAKDVSVVLDKPYDPVSGTVIPATDRLAALDELRSLYVVGDGQGPMAKKGRNVLATEGVLERGKKLLTESVKRREMLAEERERARQDGDNRKVQRLIKAFDEEQAFEAGLDKKLLEYEANLDEQRKADKQRAAAAKALKYDRAGMGSRR